MRVIRLNALQFGEQIGIQHKLKNMLWMRLPLELGVSNFVAIGAELGWLIDPH